MAVRHTTGASGAGESIPGPVRTCVGCRTRAARSDLIRLVATPEGSARVDPHGKLPGRSAWIHPDPRCWERARTRRALVGALRLAHDVDDRLWSDLEGFPQTGVREHPNTSDGSGLEADGHPMSTQR